MPGRDGTGPRGAGAMTGGGFGYCAGGTGGVGFGAGLGMGLGRRRGRGFGRGFYGNMVSAQEPVMEKDALSRQKRLLESRLALVNERLENLPE